MNDFLMGAWIAISSVTIVALFFWVIDLTYRVRDLEGVIKMRKTDRNLCGGGL